MWQKLVAQWDGLPHGMQAVIVGFGGGALGVLEPVIEQWAGGAAVCSVALGLCVKTYLLSAVKAGCVAVMGLYIKSSLHK